MPVPPELWSAADEAGRASVVVIDDDPSYRRLLVRSLRRAELGIDVLEEATGVEGLLAIGRANPAVIVLDYNLPDIDGSQVVERLIAPGTGLTAEVVVITVGLPAGAAARLRVLGLETVVDKSDGMDAVVEAVRRALARRILGG